MPVSQAEVALINTAITVLPSIIALIKGSTATGTPAPTDAEIIAALQQAITSSLAKDAAWLATHPTT